VDGVLDQAMSLRLTVLAWSPLGGGRVSTPSTPREAAVAEALDRVAASFEVSRAAAAYAWILAHPAQPIPIVGSQRIERIRAATDAFKIRFERRDWYAVLTAARGAPLP
jgi:predicted oxidoreductase